MVVAAAVVVGLCLATHPWSASGVSKQRSGRTVPPNVLLAPASTLFGGQAGYVWMGRVVSVSGSWIVPRVLGVSRSRAPFLTAYTWIGAQAPEVGLAIRRVPFIQVGTTEEAAPGCPPHARGCPKVFYEAWWTDTDLDVSPQRLSLAVRPGDRMSATLRLAGGDWSVQMSDGRTHKRSLIRTRQETQASFDQAEWDLEVPPAQRNIELPTVGFNRLEINSEQPLESDLLTAWLSNDGQVLGPSPLVHDQFRFVQQHPTRTGRQYQALSEAARSALIEFETDAQTWTPSTQPGIVTTQRSAFASALATFVGRVGGDRWPEAARPAINRLIEADRVELAQAHIDPTLSAAGLQQWRNTLQHDINAASTAALPVRRALRLSTY
jgi:hypothetical protein